MDQMVDFITSEKEWNDHELIYDDIKVSTKYDMNDKDDKKTLTSKHSKDITNEDYDHQLKRKRQDKN